MTNVIKGLVMKQSGLASRSGPNDTGKASYSDGGEVSCLPRCVRHHLFPARRACGSRHHNRAARREHVTARTLFERLRAHGQVRARLAEAGVKLKLDKRKQRTRRLVEKTGLLELDSNALYGALLSLYDGADDKAQLETSEVLDGRAFDREACDEGTSRSGQFTGNLVGQRLPQNDVVQSLGHRARSRALHCVVGCEE